MYILLGFFMVIANNSNIKDNNYHIARFFVANYMRMETLTLQDVADQCFVSVPTVKSFLRKFGFTSFARFKHTITVDAAIRLQQIHKGYEALQLEEMQRAIFSLSNHDSLPAFLQDHQLAHIVEACAQAKRIVIFGSISFNQLLINFQTDMIVMRKTVLISSLIPENLMDVEEGDLLILVSGSGRLLLYNNEIMGMLHRLKNSIVVVSGDNESSYSFPIMEKLFVKAINDMFDAEYIVMFYFDCIRYRYFQQYIEVKQHVD